ncbi:MAG: T9SS type A sorting domain-containing protein [Bacteroidales bacterium]
MKTILFLLGFALLPVLLHSQNMPACDSVQIECCSFTTIGPNAVNIQVANQSSYLFPYPGFILFNTAKDTIAIETVNYFGIGTFPQIHTLEIKEPFEIPFEGLLELHSLFFEEYNCTFPLMIEDSVQTMVLESADELLNIYPNPAKDVIYLEIDNTNVVDKYSLAVINSVGETVLLMSLTNNKIQLQSKKIGPSGMYFFRVTDQNGTLHYNHKVILTD